VNDAAEARAAELDESLARTGEVTGRPMMRWW
jgi:hypothetical protein